MSNLQARSHCRVPRPLAVARTTSHRLHDPSDMLGGLDLALNMEELVVLEELEVVSIYTSNADGAKLAFHDVAYL
jgi:hypothetical protein